LACTSIAILDPGLDRPVAGSSASCPFRPLPGRANAALRTLRVVSLDGRSASARGGQSVSKRMDTPVSSRHRSVGVTGSLESAVTPSELPPTLPAASANRNLPTRTRQVPGRIGEQIVFAVRAIGQDTVCPNYILLDCVRQLFTWLDGTHRCGAHLGLKCVGTTVLMGRPDASSRHRNIEAPGSAAGTCCGVFGATCSVRRP
jgi:hypothetical protein